MDKKESRILFKNKFNQLANFSLENLLLPQESIESSLRKEGSWGMVDIAKIPNLDLQLVGFLQDDYDFSGYELDEWGDPADDRTYCVNILLCKAMNTELNGRKNSGYFGLY